MNHMVLCLIGKGTSNKPPNMSTMFANVSGPWLQSLCQINTGQTAVRFTKLTFCDQAIHGI